MTTQNTANDAPDFVITRVVKAPVDLVYRAYTEAERLAQWWGPKGFTATVANLDLRPGGTFHYALRSLGGQEMWGKWEFREIVPRERLVFLASFSDPEGNTTRAPFSETWPLEVLSVVAFTSQDDGTTLLTLTGTPWNATDAERATFAAGKPSMEQGYGGTLDQLAAYLATV